MDIVFMGTPDFAVASLKALHESKHTVKGVVTVPDKPAGRGRKLQQSAVKQYALREELPVLQPVKLRDESFLSELRNLNPDLIVVVAFRMLPKQVWDLPRHGTINLHASLLPNYRGAAPINWAVINGETKTGATTFFINEAIDTGAILLQTEIDIKETNTAGEVHDELMLKGAELIVKTVSELEDGNLKAEVQKLNGNEKAAPKIFKSDLRLDFSKTADEIYNHIRGLSPFPAAYAEMHNDGEPQQIKIYRATKTHMEPTLAPGKLQQAGKKELLLHAKGGVLALTEVQLQGKKRMNVSDFLNGTSIKPDAHLA